MVKFKDQTLKHELFCFLRQTSICLVSAAHWQAENSDSNGSPMHRNPIIYSLEKYIIDNVIYVNHMNKKQNTS
jgi:hypothetical protein